MNRAISKLLDKLSDFISHRKGLLPIIGIVLIIANFFLKLFADSWLSETDLLLHVGLIAAILGYMLAWAL